jgi:7-carboxy-7-deazaguanine synthase
MQSLCDDGYTVLIETSGALDISKVDSRVHRIMDLKCPGSGEVGKNLYGNIRHLDKKDEVKFVITDRADYDWAKQQLAEHNVTGTCTVLFAPVWEKLPLKTLADWILADKLPVRMQTQWHKYIWGADARGV